MISTFSSARVELKSAEKVSTGLWVDSNTFSHAAGQQPRQSMAREPFSAYTTEKAPSPDAYIQAFAHAPTGMALIKLSTGRFVYVNPSMCNALGYSAKELLQMPLSSISHPDDVRTEQTWLEAAKTEYGNLTISYNKRLITKEEKTLWTYVHGTVRYTTPIADDDIIAVYALTSGSTTEKRLRADRAIFGGLLDIAHDAFIVVDGHQRIVRFNKGAEHMFGYTKSEVLGRDLDMLIPHQHRKAHQGYVKNFYLGAEQSRMMNDRATIQGLHKNGTIFDAEASIARLHADNTHYFSVLLRDITARNRAEAELRTAKELAENANNANNRLLGIAAHDIKNPLSNIRTIVSLLQEDDNNTETTAEYLSLIQAEAARAFAIVSDLLSLNALDAGAMQYTLEPLDLRLPVASIVKSYKIQAEQKNITLHCKTEPENIPVQAPIDYKAIMQVLDNLVSNAIKYTPHNRNIYIVLSAQNDVARISIRDEGPGISDEDKKQLFQRFARLSAQPTGGESSTGLGLSIAKHIITLLHGSLWCESTAGKGATFIVELPLVPPNPTGIQVYPDQKNDMPL